MRYPVFVGVRLSRQLYADLLARVPPDVPLSSLVRKALVEYILTHPVQRDPSAPALNLFNKFNAKEDNDIAPVEGKARGWKFWGTSGRSTRDKPE